ncbi:LysR family transcriptional regulator [Paraferrimonas sedimenticola]|uniref:LysR family transcriptional regulator n=1 Tax=Paraferrimonas sedimenticola TaxID=375674 RepID=A0AA37RVR3_9GAMM|nr:LysR family transcriptional regulator [Paraferrimonas sedimenticola]GLP96171.1 LysR family transcriptional regulator [Paraferrimonas sedimenticola]
MYRTRVTLEQWRILQAVVDYGGYAHAAKALNKSQSSLNHAVAKMQDQLGVQLLEVVGRKAQLTPQGEVLLRRSRELSSSAAALEQLANKMEQGWEPEIRISREVLYPMQQLVCALNEFHPEGRGTRITVIDTVLSGSVDCIESQSVDLAITATPPSGYSYQPLMPCQLWLVCHPHHPLASRPQPLLESELTQALQLVVRDSGSHPEDRVGWLKSEQRWTFSNFHEALVALKKGLGFCWLPQDMAQPLVDSRQLTRLTLTGSTERQATMSLVVPDRDNLGPAAQLMEKIILAQHGLESPQS